MTSGQGLSMSGLAHNSSSVTSDHNNDWGDKWFSNKFLALSSLLCVF